MRMNLEKWSAWLSKSSLVVRSCEEAGWAEFGKGAEAWSAGIGVGLALNAGVDEQAGEEGVCLLGLADRFPVRNRGVGELVKV